MLILNSQMPGQNYHAAEGGPSAEQAKTVDRSNEGKADTNTPDTNRPDDYTRPSNRQDLYQRAQKAVAELRSHGKDKEAHDLEYSLQVAQEKEGQTFNSDKFKANFANRVNRLLREATSTIVGAKYGLEDPKPPQGPVVFREETITGSRPGPKPLPAGYEYGPNQSVVKTGGGERATAGKAPDIEGPKPNPA